MLYPGSYWFHPISFIAVMALLLTLLSGFSCIELCRPHGQQPSGSLCPCRILRQNTGVSCRFLLRAV